MERSFVVARQLTKTIIFEKRGAFGKKELKYKIAPNIAKAIFKKKFLEKRDELNRVELAKAASVEYIEKNFEKEYAELNLTQKQTVMDRIIKQYSTVYEKKTNGWMERITKTLFIGLFIEVADVITKQPIDIKENSIALGIYFIILTLSHKLATSAQGLSIWMGKIINSEMKSIYQ